MGISVTNQNLKNHHKESSRKAYTTPELTHYGAVKDLTSGGTGGPEMGKSKNLTRRA